ncbi:hypothetical protein PVT67_12500 [Gallaecimonas kandeliae]|uniref:hypothetical protein n=1 Tax=Gallaecimonas kandeliae TaxID=3029055 RepID=UPI002649CAD5|nr:hypothetical protein [Gallaecimonas kandeliae]WKE64485.1 hypothetical protein PVT67_12500 [Gallaecimonas kandeliae]
MADPIAISINPDWVNEKTRPACKYSPVIVDKKQSPGAITSMQQALRKRVITCQTMAAQKNTSWFSFLRAGPSHEPHLRPSNVPVIVISGGSAKKLALDLSMGYSLAWHPMNLRNEPLYLLVHKLDFNNYAQAMAGLMAQYRNMHLIGWTGTDMTGFGAARAAALAFADSLPYRPQRILLMDQDVVQTEASRHTNPEVHRQLVKKHTHGKLPIVGLGVGYPTRVPVPKPFSDVGAPSPKDFNSPAQQFVSIQAPFRQRMNSRAHAQETNNDGIYPSYMVAGGEDMLMGLQLGLNNKDDNEALLPAKIQKKALQGPPDNSNEYWNGARVETLRRLYEAEKNTLLLFDNEEVTLSGLMEIFHAKGWISKHPSDESYNVSACVIERIILRLYKLGSFPADIDSTIFNR